MGKYEGTFQSFGVYADEGWYLYEDHGKILIHSAPYKLVDGEKVYEDMEALGAYPASHGCIRLAPGRDLVHRVEPPGRAVGDPAEGSLNASVSTRSVWIDTT